MYVIYTPHEKTHDVICYEKAREFFNVAYCWWCSQNRDLVGKYFSLWQIFKNLPNFYLFNQNVKYEENKKHAW